MVRAPETHFRVGTVSFIIVFNLFLFPLPFSQLRKRQTAVDAAPSAHTSDSFSLSLSLYLGPSFSSFGVSNAELIDGAGGLPSLPFLLLFFSLFFPFLYSFSSRIGKNVR